MNISIDAGHNCTPDIGATGIRQEDNLTKEVVELVIYKLNQLGNTVTDCTPYGRAFSNVGQSLNYRCNKANASGSELHLCIHFNAGGGTGTEVYAVSQKGREYAEKILNEICSLGYANRGVLDGSHLYVVNATNMPCNLIECSFVDNQNDMNKYIANDFANAIVKAVTGKEVSDVTVQQAINNPIIASIQKLCNDLGIKDSNNNGLTVDGVPGPLTNSAISKLPLLFRGSKGDYVKWIQERLITLGFSCGKAGADGDFEYCTLVAVQNFQTTKGLTADGLVGPKTLAALLQ